MSHNQVCIAQTWTHEINYLFARENILQILIHFLFYIFLRGGRESCGKAEGVFLTISEITATWSIVKTPNQLFFLSLAYTFFKLKTCTKVYNKLNGLIEIY